MKTYSNSKLDDLVQKAKDSERSRLNLNLHQSYEEPCQRLLNAIGLSSYIRPHRHQLDPKLETLIAVRGLFALITFDDHGKILDVVKFGTERYLEVNGVCVGVEIPPNVWHTVIALKDNSVLFEVKEGPFDPLVAKEFAEWAPAETDFDVFDYLGLLRSALLDDISIKTAD